MSKANAKQQTPAAQAAQEPAAQPPAPPATAAAAHQPRALVRPSAPARDEHTGKGGLYTRQGGARQLVERTDAVPAATATPRTTRTSKE